MLHDANYFVTVTFITIVRLLITHHFVAVMPLVDRVQALVA